MENGLSSSNESCKDGVSRPNAASTEQSSLDALSKLAPLPSDPSTTQHSILLGSLARDGGGTYELYLEQPPTNSHPGALFYVTKTPPSTPEDKIGVRVYCAYLPKIDGTRWTTEAICRFNTLKPERFEAFFTNDCHGRLVFDQDQTAEEKKPRLPEAPAWDDFFEPLGNPVATLTRRNGAHIRVYRDAIKNDVVVTFSANKSHFSDCIAFRIKNSEHWLNVQPIIEQLDRLRTSDEEHLVDTLRDFILRDTKGQRGIIFKGTLPTSTPISDLMGTLPPKLANRIDLSRVEDHTALTCSQKLLNQEECLIAHHTFIPPTVDLHFNSIALTVSNGGCGSCALEIAHKEGGRLNYNTTLEPVALISYDFDISDMSRSARHAWLIDMLQAFQENRDSLYGPLTTFIEQNCDAHSTVGTVRMIERSRTPHLESFYIKESKALNFFTHEISSIFQFAQPEVLAKTHEGAIIQATNAKGDRLQFTVRPKGVEEIFVLPRSGSFASPSDTPLAIGFSLSHHYQLGLTSPTFLGHLANVFRSENGKIRKVTDKRNIDIGHIGACKTYEYLTSLTSGDARVNCIVITPPQPLTRCAKEASIIDITLARGLA